MRKENNFKTEEKLLQEQQKLTKFEMEKELKLMEYQREMKREDREAADRSALLMSAFYQRYVGRDSVGGILSLQVYAGWRSDAVSCCSNCSCS